MKRFVYCLMATVAICSFSACEKEEYYGRTTLSHMTIECIVEEPSTPTSTGDYYYEHTYLCSGYLWNYTGVCHIEIWGNEHDLISDDCKIKAAGDNTSFNFSFTTKQAYLDHYDCNFIVKVCDNNGNVLYQSIVVATHPND